MQQAITALVAAELIEEAAIAEATEVVAAAWEPQSAGVEEATLKDAT